jgi:hypothetical protein
MDRSFCFTDYYKKSFVDPLYEPYIHSSPPVNHSYTPLTFMKRHSNYPCPGDYVDVGGDFCVRKAPVTSNFYKIDGLYIPDTVRLGLDYKRNQIIL